MIETIELSVSSLTERGGMEGRGVNADQCMAYPVVGRDLDLLVETTNVDED